MTTALKIEFGGSDGPCDSNGKPVYSQGWIEFSLDPSRKSILIDRWFGSGDNGARKQLESVVTCHRLLSDMATAMAYDLDDVAYQTDLRDRFSDLTGSVQPVSL